jgi:membrane protein
MRPLRSFFALLWALLRETFASWWSRDPFNISVVIAYYTIFSLPGLLVIIINLAGVAFGTEAVTHQISGQISSMVGADAASDIEQIIATAGKNKDSIVATVLSVATLLFGATGVFYQLQQALNQMWNVEPKPKGRILKVIKDRLFSFGLVLVVGFLLLVSLLLSTAVSAMNKWIGARISASLEGFFHVMDIVSSVGVITLLFAAIYKFLPDVKIAWRDVWPGALLTAILFSIAKFLLGLYFGESEPGSAYGAAGTVVLIMLWVSYAGLIVLYGAEFTRIYANRHLSREQRDSKFSN